MHGEGLDGADFDVGCLEAVTEAAGPFINCSSSVSLEPLCNLSCASRKSKL
jgi:hypothetical protein